MKTYTTSFGSAIAILAVVAALPGCVERNEKIRVAPDGSVKIELKYEGEERELDGPDAMPSLRSGWEVTRTVKKEQDHDKHILKATRIFEPGDALPSSFAGVDDPDADLYLSFPTDLRIERRRDGTYYYFHRTYESRPWAFVRNWQDEFIDDDIKKLADQPLEELSAAQRGKIVQAFAMIEAFKQLEFAKNAIDESHPDLAVEYKLMARRALLNYYQQLEEIADGEEQSPFDRILSKCTPLEEDAENECFDTEVQLVLDAAYNAYVQSLRDDAKLGKANLEAFRVAYARAQRHYEVSNQIGGHSFFLEVTMPGTIIAHNGFEDDVEVDEDNNTSTVELYFEGDWLHDQPYEIIVVSRLAHGKGGR